MRIEELDYHLPEDRIAQTAAEPRDHARLLVVDRQGGTLADRRFYDLPQYLSPGDVLVLNDTRVIPARVFFHKAATKGRVEGLFLREHEPGVWEMMIKGMAKLRTGAELTVEGSGETFRVGRRLSAKTLEILVSSKVPAVEFLGTFGQVPLPPYIRRTTGKPEDRQRYQTVFSATPGAVAAPTAGLHFTETLLNRIRAAGITIATVTLHVGLGTFEPLAVTEVEKHPMHGEWYSLTAESAAAVNAARAAGRKIVAVGTTSVRVLETACSEAGACTASGWTDIFIYPPYRFKIVDRMVTNFHLPRTTLLALVFAFAGRELALRAYEHAVAEGYRFYSYGDAMIIL